MAVEVSTKNPYQSVPEESIPGLTPKLQDPPLCECARVGKRSLSWAPWLGIFSKGPENSFLNRNNLEMAHEHVYFEGSKDNIGFGPHGMYEEEVEKLSYRWEQTCYDGTTMREALRTVTPMGSYNFFTNNCQDFMARVKERYRQLWSR